MYFTRRGWILFFRNVGVVGSERLRITWGCLEVVPIDRAIIVCLVFLCRSSLALRCRMREILKISSMNKAFAKNIKGEETTNFRSSPEESQWSSNFEIQELNKAPKKMKLRKSPGSHQIIPEFLKNIGRVALHFMLDYFYLIILTSNIHNEFQKTKILWPYLNKENQQITPPAIVPLRCFSCLCFCRLIICTWYAMERRDDICISFNKLFYAKRSAPSYKTF